MESRSAERADFLSPAGTESQAQPVGTNLKLRSHRQSAIFATANPVPHPASPAFGQVLERAF
jgi:hypothetical protein